MDVKEREIEERLTAAEAGQEIAAKVRAQVAGQPTDPRDLYQSFARLMQSEASTAVDAFALIVMVRQLLNGIQIPENTQEGYFHRCAMQLVLKAIAALEIETGEVESAYTGHDWH